MALRFLHKVGMTKWERGITRVGQTDKRGSKKKKRFGKKEA
jgi:hypothetical protein